MNTYLSNINTMYYLLDDFKSLNVHVGLGFSELKKRVNELAYVEYALA